MKTYLWWAVTVGQVCLLGCAQQQLGGGGPGADAGCGPPGKIACGVSTSCTTTTAIAPVCVNGSWTCPAEPGPTVRCEPPICPPSLKPGCACDPATGVTTCSGTGATCAADAPDGAVLFCAANCNDTTAVISTCDGGVWSCPPGTTDLRACGSRDAGSSCPPYGADGGFLSCTYNCNNDTGVAAVCNGGAWTCPTGTIDTRTCPPPSPPRCAGPSSPGCFCDPTTGVVTCSGDGGRDATSAGHGG